ncbi:MAG: Dyp-type peroxidase [Planctomycetota bacterium]
MTVPVQPGILEPIPAAARYLSFRLRADTDPRPALEALARRDLGERTVVGLGLTTVLRLGREVPGLRELPALAGTGVGSPSTPLGLWCWLRGEDPGELLHRGRALAGELAPAFALDEAVSAFRYAGGLDLSGYEDGTENPAGDDALAAACVAGLGAGLDGSSFVAAQRWVHDLDRAAGFERAEMDHTIGRRLSDNEELDDAPPSAHVKRAAQESFEPPAFMLRRSMPWSDGPAAGLVFVAFGRSFEAFVAVLRRMLGLEDGISDGLFRFTHPVTGSAAWCPPVRPDGRLDLSALGIGA